MPWGQQIKSLEKILEKRGVIREIRRSSAKDGVAAHTDVDFAAAKDSFHSTFSSYQSPKWESRPI